LLETIFSANDEGMLSLAALDLVQRTDRVAIVRAISGLGHSLNITTTAEGVETIEQLDWRRVEGCNEVQGFLFSAEKPASEIAELLARFGARVSQAAQVVAGSE
jgi:EAL domain-containing protein (putative c-di-GMP-specific phosphodiesterase class I)